MRHVFAAFKDLDQATEAVEKLEAARYDRRRLRVMTKENIHADRHPFGQYSYAPHIALRLALLGGLFGASVLTVLALTSFAVPGIGPLSATPGLAIGAGFVGGAVLGAMAGCLAGLGRAQADARILANEIDQGHVLLSVDVAQPGRIEQTRHDLREMGALHVAVC